MVVGDAIISNEYAAPGFTGTPSVGQSVLGGTTLETAEITRVFSDKIVVKNLSGDFLPGETVTSTTFSCTLGTQAVYKNLQGEPEYYWYPLQTNIPCYIYTTRNDPNVVMTPGEVQNGIIKIILPENCTITKFDKIVSLIPGFVGDFGVTGGIFVFQSPSGIDHYEAVLRQEV